MERFSEFFFFNFVFAKLVLAEERTQQKMEWNEAQEKSMVCVCLDVVNKPFYMLANW